MGIQSGRHIGNITAVALASTVMRFSVVLLAAGIGCNSDSRSCEDVERDADALVASVQECQTDSDCVIASVGGDCLLAFLCSTALNKNTNREELRQSADDLSEEYHAHCSGCAIVSCPDPSSLRAVCDSGRCATVMP